MTNHPDLPRHITYEEIMRTIADEDLALNEEPCTLAEGKWALVGLTLGLLIVALLVWSNG